ncbi:MAG TPA: NUDIX domain-containing protein [Stellaceae bacterium]|nr:NUDIX domain-containing protein [Stellaceae bacterium]
MLRVEALDGEPVIELLPAPALDSATQRTVDAIWEREQQSRARALFDGRLLSLIARDGRNLRGCLVDYRRFIAQRRAPALFPLLRVRPVAVSGLLMCGDSVVFGRRSAATTQDGGRWELVPSGGIGDSARDPRGQLLQELAEETGIPTAAVNEIVVFALIEDEGAHTTDIGYALRTALSAAEIARLHKEAASGEYDRIEIVAADALPGFVAAQDVIAVSRALLRERRLA